jgi:xanthine dehydrogenase YagR molybdenum-binding subunit
MTRPIPAAQLATGQPVTRVDGRLKVTGKAAYAADNQLANLAYAVLVTSTVARGRIDRLDSAAAQRHPDVLRVLTDFTGVKLPYDPRQVAYFGQPVAVVVAATLEAATHGASLVEVRYSSQPQLTDIDAPQAVPQQGKQ